MQRISVDFPEPEGPHMTMRSPSDTERSMSFNAWKSPYHLLTPSMLTAILDVPRDSLVALLSVTWLIARNSALTLWRRRNPAGANPAISHGSCPIRHPPSP